jgi:RNA polymerase sigma-70 factor, ECF subfamily
MNKTTSLVRPLSKRKLNLIHSEIITAHHDYGGALIRRALYKTNDIEKSQDLVQSTFLKTLLYLQKGGKVDLMRGFLNHVLNDLIIDEYRKHKITSLDTLIENGFEPSVDNSKRMTDIIDGKAASLSISHLPQKYEQVISLRYIKGLSLKEIAALTKQSENTVAVQVHRGLMKLRKLHSGM